MKRYGIGYDSGMSYYSFETWHDGDPHMDLSDAEAEEFERFLAEQDKWHARMEAAYLARGD